MSYFLYVLENDSGRHYIGIAENVDKRLAKHNSGSVRSTKAFRPWRVAICKEFQNKTLARKQELFLKKNYLARAELFSKA
jgi:putative endonuclease